MYNSSIDCTKLWVCNILKTSMIIKRLKNNFLVLLIILIVVPIRKLCLDFKITIEIRFVIGFGWESSVQMEIVNDHQRKVN